MALSRGGRGGGRTAPPVRLVHLGLGNFFRAHQAWYTDQAPDALEWGYAAFDGRSATRSEALRGQDGLYTLVTRAADRDRFDVISSVSRVHGASDYDTWLGYFMDPAVSLVTVTVTEAGYLRSVNGGLDHDREEVRMDVDALRRDRTAPVRTAPARLVAGLAARRAADAGPLTLVPCDNLPGNGAVVAGVVRDLAGMVDPALADWIERSVPSVTTMVDRITPRTDPEDIAAVAVATGRRDAAPVITEPFREWVLSGTFAAGRPRWQETGATFAEDITPFENRKLWLLNGGHSLLAYAGSIRGHRTVAGAMADDAVVGWLQQWWTEACTYLPLPEANLAGYTTALFERFRNPRMRHQLAQIAADGSQKLPVRILPTLVEERAAGRTPPGATLVLAAWVCHLRGLGTPVRDVRADEFLPLAKGALPQAVRRVLSALAPHFAGDDQLASAVLFHAERLHQESRP